MQTNLALLKVHDWSENDNGGGDFYDLGTIGVPVDHVFTITNDGAQAATLMADGGGLGSGFGWKGGNYPGTDGDVPGARWRPARTARWSSASRRRAAGPAPASSSSSITTARTRSTRSGRCPRPRRTSALLQITDWSNPESPNGPGQPPYDYGTAGGKRATTRSRSPTGARSPRP